MDRLASDRMFIAVMETGSFTAAAGRFGVRSGQASKLVSKLEADLGVRLLNRTTRAVSPTEVGQAYFEQIRQLIEEFDNLDQSVRDTAQSPRGRIRLSAPLNFGTGELTVALAGFALAYPEISLDVSYSDRKVSLVDEGFDAAVRIGASSDVTLISRKLREMQTVVVASQDYLDRAGTPEIPADLTDHACILDTNMRDPEHWVFRDAEGVVSVPVNGRLRFSNAEACLKAAEAGLGIANAPDFVAVPRLKSGKMRALLTDYSDGPASVSFVYPTGRHLAAKIRVLSDYLAAHFRKSGGLAA